MDQQVRTFPWRYHLNNATACTLICSCSLAIFEVQCILWSEGIASRPEDVITAYASIAWLALKWMFVYIVLTRVLATGEKPLLLPLSWEVVIRLLVAYAIISIYPYGHPVFVTMMINIGVFRNMLRRERFMVHYYESHRGKPPEVP